MKTSEISCLPERFRKFIRVDPGGCWLWTGHCSESGHGQYKADGRTVMAHRYAYECITGQQLLSCVVLRHRCNHPACVNPAHLMLGSHADNVADRVAARRSACGERNGRARLTAEQVAAIRAEYTPGQVGYGTLARRYGVSARAISYIVAGRHWAEPG
jgi:hypothetical protein